jgi:ketosteroid isomerase-like protein
MDREARETVGHAFTAFNRRDLPALLAACDAEIDWIPMRASVAGAGYRGHVGVERALADVEREFEELQIDPRHWVEVDERIVVSGRFVAKERATGLRMDSPGAWLCELNGVLVTRLQAFPSEEAALEAARARG